MPVPSTCPICAAALAPQAAQESPLYPFCSLRCKQVDFFRWTSGRYAVVEPLSIERLQQEASEDDSPAWPPHDLPGG